MRLTSFPHKVLAAALFVAFACVSLVSCSEDEPEVIVPDIPDIPGTSTYTMGEGYLVLGPDSLKIDAVQIVKAGDISGIGEMNMTLIYLSNGKFFECFNTLPTSDSITLSFSDMTSLANGSCGCYGVMMDAYGFGDGEDLSAGSITFVKVDADHYRIYITGSTTSGKVVKAFYKGGVIDEHHTTGSGFMSISGNSVSLDYCMMSWIDSMYNYALTDATMANELLVKSKSRLNGTATISANDEEVQAGNTVGVSIVYTDRSTGESEDHPVTSGSISCTRNGNTYQVSISGSTDVGAVNCTYSGNIIEVFTDKFVKLMKGRIMAARR